MDKVKTWALIANASKAKIYSFYIPKLFNGGGAQSLELIGCYVHNASRLKEQDLVSDNEGRFGNRKFADTTLHKTHEAESFALQLVHQFKTGFNDKKFQNLVLVAPAHFIGFLEKHMPHELKKITSKTIEKDFTAHDDQSLVKDLVNYL